MCFMHFLHIPHTEQKAGSRAKETAAWQRELVWQWLCVWNIFTVFTKHFVCVFASNFFALLFYFTVNSLCHLEVFTTSQHIFWSSFHLISTFLISNSFRKSFYYVFIILFWFHIWFEFNPNFVLIWFGLLRVLFDGVSIDMRIAYIFTNPAPAIELVSHVFSLFEWI